MQDSFQELVEQCGYETFEYASPVLERMCLGVRTRYPIEVFTVCLGRLKLQLDLIPFSELGRFYARLDALHQAMLNVKVHKDGIYFPCIEKV